MLQVSNIFTVFDKMIYLHMMSHWYTHLEKQWKQLEHTSQWALSKLYCSVRMTENNCTALCDLWAIYLHSEVDDDLFTGNIQQALNAFSSCWDIYTNNSWETGGFNSWETGGFNSWETGGFNRKDWKDK